MRTSTFILLAPLVPLLSCSTEKTDPDLVDASAFEGDDPGECSDGADNDRDGFYDCDDQECWNSPDCGGGDADTDTDTDSDTDTDTDTDANPNCLPHVCDLTRMEVTYRLDIVPILPLPSAGYIPCYVVMDGAGTFAEGELSTAIFQGTWTVTEDTCSQTVFEFPAGLWYDEATGEAYHTVRFDDEGFIFEEWFAHKRITGNNSDSNNSRFYVIGMDESHDEFAAEQTLEYQEAANPDGFTDFISTLSVTLYR